MVQLNQHTEAEQRLKAKASSQPHLDRVERKCHCYPAGMGRGWGEDENRALADGTSLTDNKKTLTADLIRP